MQKKKRIKVRPYFDPYWLVKEFTAFAPVRFTYETSNTEKRKVGFKNFYRIKL